MRRLFALRLLLASTLFASALALTLGCDNRAGRRVADVRINGSSTVFAVSDAVAEEFRAERPDVKVTVKYTGTGGGMEQFARGDIDICNASRAIKEEEIKRCAQAGVEWLELTVARDGIAVVVHPENDWAGSLSVEQLRGIWSPAPSYTKWSDIHPQWPDEEIRLFGPDSDSGTFDYFTKVIVGEEKASHDHYMPSANDNQLVKGVSDDPYALGYFGFAYYAENNDKLRIVPIDGGKGPVTPTVESIGDNTYAPLSRPLFVYVSRQSLERKPVADFVQFYIDNAPKLAPAVDYVAAPPSANKENQEKFDAAMSKE